MGGAPPKVCGSFMSILMPILVALHVIVCLLLVLVVLMQRPRSEGLGSAFGGGITDNVFGSQTTNVLARFTTWMAIGFFAVTLLLSILTAKANSGKTEIQKKLLSAPVPEATAQPSPAAVTETQPSIEPPAAEQPAATPAAEAPKTELPTATPVTEAPKTELPAETPAAEAPAAPAPVDSPVEPAQN